MYTVEALEGGTLDTEC